MVLIDVIVLVAFLLVVAGVSLWASRGEGTRADYFLAGRGLTWWLIGFSLIASNISTEHFVGMTGTAAKHGIAVAGFEWVAAVALVIVAWWFLPRFLAAGIFTIPEFLERRFDRTARSLLAGLMVIFFVITVLATVLNAGAIFLVTILDLDEWLQAVGGLDPAAAQSWAFTLAVWGIGILAGSYTIFGGLKAVVFSDLIQGAALLFGGLAVTWLALQRLGDGEVIEGWARFQAAHGDQMHLVRGPDDPNLPGISLLSGIWIPVLFYWGLNQFITQRALAAGSLAEGQKGICFAAAIKLILPVAVV